MLKLFRLIRPYRSFIAIVLVLALAQSLANLYLPRLMADIVDHGIVKGDTREILSIGGLMLLMALVGTAVRGRRQLLLVEDRHRLRPDRPRRDLRPRRALLACTSSIASAPRR